jgi:hypothetical protein
MDTQIPFFEMHPFALRLTQAKKNDYLLKDTEDGYGATKELDKARLKPASSKEA